jgi:hypothetical protein
MSGLTLYNITNKFVELMDKAENEDLTEEEVQLIATELEQELSNKASNIVAYIKNGESLIDAIKDEETRLEAMRRTGERKLEKFKTYVIENMNRLGLKEIPTQLGSLKIAKNPMSIEIENEDEIPSEFKKEIVKITVDKTAIKNHFKDTGEIVAGTRVVTEKESLRIK